VGSMTSEADGFLEAVVELRKGADASRVENWLGTRGLATSRMVVGFLITGDPAAFDAAFGVKPAELPLSGELPVPAELRHHVAAVSIVPPKRTHRDPDSAASGGSVQ
jgi:hypothetical protein